MQATRDVLADAAPQLVVKLAQHLDDQLAAVARGPVASLADALPAVNATRQALWAVARTRWRRKQLPPEPQPLDAGGLVQLALAGPGHASAMWGAVVEADRRAAERAAAEAAEAAKLAAAAAERPGRMVVGGPGTFGVPDLLPPPSDPLTGRR